MREWNICAVFCCSLLVMSAVVFVLLTVFGCLTQLKWWSSPPLFSNTGYYSKEKGGSFFFTKYTLFEETQIMKERNNEKEWLTDHAVWIDHVHNSRTWRKICARTGCVGQKIWREPRFSGLFVLRSKSCRPCDGCLLGCSCDDLPIFQLRIARTLLQPREVSDIAFSLFFLFFFYFFSGQSVLLVCL